MKSSSQTSAPTPKIEHGCVVIHDTPSLHQFRPLLRLLGTGKLYDVRSRKRGITSSGKPNRCHANVVLAVKAFGGKRIWGWSICCDLSADAPNEYLMLFSHSIWETPEGEWVDLTKSSDIEGVDVMFMPISSEHSETFHNTRLVIPRKWRKEGLVACLGEDTADDLKMAKSIPRMVGSVVQVPVMNAYGIFVKPKVLKSIVKGTTLGRKILKCLTPPAIVDWDSPEMIQQGGFTEPSAFTGKTFDEIYAERVCSA